MANPSPVSASVTASPIVDVSDHYDTKDQQITSDAFEHVARYLIYRRAFGSCANLNVTSRSVYDTTLPVLWKTVWIAKDKSKGMMLALRKKSKAVKHVQYLIHPDTTGDPQGLCIAAIKRALAPKACIVGPVLLSGETFDEGETTAFSSSKRVVVYILDSFYARGSGDLVELWEAIGLLRGRIPERGYHDGLNVNLVVQVHSDRVREEWNVQHKPLTERLTNLDPLRFQKFDFHHGQTLVSSPRIEAFLADLSQLEGMQAGVSKLAARTAPDNMLDKIMAAFYCQEMRFFGCNQHNMRIVSRALENAIKACRFNCLGAFEIFFRPDPSLSTVDAKAFIQGVLEQLQPPLTAAFDKAWLMDTLVIRRGLRIWCEPEKTLQGFIKFDRSLATVATITDGGRVVYERKCRN